MDKLIGLLLRTNKDLASGFVIVTNRASYELVQKAAYIGITMLAAMSAPTGLAIRLADEAGLTLIGFARNDQHVVYTHPQRLTHTNHIIQLRTMKIERLIKMANDIGDFFNAESNKEIAADGVKKHILRSWDLRMRREIIAYCRQDGTALSELTRAAVSRLDAEPFCRYISQP